MKAPEKQKSTDYSGVIIAVILLPVFIFFRHIGRIDLGLNAFICLGVTLLVIRIYWNLRKLFWFWLVIIVILALHVPLALRIQWPHGWVPGIVLLPIGLADLLIYVGAIKFVERFIVKAPPSDEEN